MRIVVLGAAAGGGFPQWNANHEACWRARAGDPTARPATQASIAIETSPDTVILVNASPDIGKQIADNDMLWPKKGLRSSPIKAVLLTNADVDAIGGLLTLREGWPFALLAHRRVHATLDRNPIFEVLDRAIVRRLAFETEREIEVEELAVTAFAVPGKLPLYLEDEAGGKLDTEALDGDAVGLDLRHDGKRVVYLANCARLTDALLSRIDGADLLFMDGTLWRDDEMIRARIGHKTGKRMGHVSMSGADGVMARLDGLSIGRRIFIHINNTNPALLSDSQERREIEAAGWEVAFDGMEIEP